MRVVLLPRLRQPLPVAPAFAGAPAPWTLWAITVRPAPRPEFWGKGARFSNVQQPACVARPAHAWRPTSHEHGPARAQRTSHWVAKHLPPVLAGGTVWHGGLLVKTRRGQGRPVCEPMPDRPPCTAEWACWQSLRSGFLPTRCWNFRQCVDASIGTEPNRWKNSDEENTIIWRFTLRQWVMPKWHVPRHWQFF